MTAVQHGRGHLPDPPDVRARRAGFHILRAKRGLTAELPLSVDLSPLVTAAGGPGIFNQGQTGSCEGHAHAGAIGVRFAKLGKPIQTPSPIGIYTLARCIGRQPDANGTLPPLTDDGTEPNLVLRAIQEWGVASIPTWGNFPADPSTINQEPTQADLEKASDFKLLGAYFLQSVGDQKVIDILTALAAGYPVSMALPASGEQFNNYAGGVLGALDGPVDHANYIVGLSIPARGAYGQVTLKCVNSWDVTWGEGGFYRGDRAFLDQLEDCVAVDVASTGAEQ